MSNLINHKFIVASIGYIVGKSLNKLFLWNTQIFTFETSEQREIAVSACVHLCPL